MATAAAAQPDVEGLRRIPLAEIHESPHNPRSHYDRAALEQLAESLLQSGQLEPVLVRPRKDGGFELAAGHRRYRAAKLAGERSPDGARFRQLGELLAIVRDLNDRDFIETLNVDNLQRADLHPLEEAQGFRDLMTACGYDVKKIAARIGKSERYVYDSLTLLKLVPEAKKMFLAGRFERGHAIEIARLSAEQQADVIDPDNAGNAFGRGEGLWQAEIAHRDPDPAQEDLELEDEDAVKPVSVRELKSYIDDHYRADPAKTDPVLFPDAAQLLADAQAKKGRASRIVHITYSYRVPDAARDPKIKTYGAEAWARADGQFKSKSCDYAQPGFVAAGPGRGQAFLVCVNKEKCAVHWAAWQKERERRRKALAGEARQSRGAAAERSVADQQAEYRRRQQEAEAEGARWKKALPALRKALAAKILAAPTARLEAALWRRHGSRALAERELPKGSTVQRLAFVLEADALDVYWRPQDTVPARLKAWGIDGRKIVDQVAPKPTAATPQTSAKPAKKAARPKKRRGK